MLRQVRGAARAGFVLIAIAAGVAAYLVVGRVAIREPAVQPPETPAPATGIPARLPDITLTDRAGQTHSLSDWQGKPLIVNFWATWCAPCRREIPLLNTLARTYGAQGFAVIGIAVDFREEVLRFVESTPVDYPVLIGEEEGMQAARAFGMETVGLPFTVFADRSGRIATIHVGELHQPQAEAILATIREIDAGRLDIDAARQQLRSAAGEI